MEDKEQSKSQYSYTYTYSSAEKEEMDAIRRKYLPAERESEETDGLARLRRIEAHVENVGSVVALAAGILGTLLLGIGMCCVLVWMGVWFIVGIPVGVIGIGVMMVAYPLYVHVTRRMRAKYTQKVLEITSEYK